MDTLVIAARTGYWGEIDMAKTTPQMINDFYYEGKNPLHIAASEGQLKKVPKEFLTKEGLEALDSKKNSVLHLAAQSQELHVIPKELLTEENLEKENIGGNTVFHYAAMRGCLNYIPENILTDRSISLTNNSGKNSLDYALEQWQPNRKDSLNKSIKKGIDLMISKLGNQRLKNYIERSNIGIKEYKMLLKSIGTKEGKEGTIGGMNKQILRKTLMSKELVRRALVKINEEQTLEV
jgi:ankyrin repeat protein